MRRVDVLNGGLVRKCESKYFEVRLKKGDSIDEFINDKRLDRLLTKPNLKKGDPVGNLLKKDVIITVDYDIRETKKGKHKSRYRCRLCGLETESIPKFTEGECPKGKQHEFMEVISHA